MQILPLLARSRANGHRRGPSVRSQAHARPRERRKVYIGRRTCESPACPTIHLPVTDGHPRTLLWCSAPAVFVGCDRAGSPARSLACRVAGQLFVVSKAATLVGASRSFVVLKAATLVGASRLLSKRQRWRATTRGWASKRREEKTRGEGEEELE